MTWEKRENKVWRPEKENEEIVGEIIGVSQLDFGTQYTLKTDDGKEVRTPCHAWLQNAMQGLDTGAKVKIVFRGHDPPKVKGHNPTPKYDVFVNK